MKKVFIVLFVLLIACSYGESFGSKNLMCEQKMLVSFEKGIEEVVFNGDDYTFFNVKEFATDFKVTVSGDKLMYSNFHGKGDWISFKEGGNSCIKWGVIGSYTTCIGIKGNQIGIYDQGTFLSPGGWSYIPMFTDGTTKIRNIKLSVITKGNEGYIKINNSKPIKIWERKTLDEFKIQKNNTCLENCKSLKKWVCNKDGTKCNEIEKTSDPNILGECYTSVSPYSGNLYKICDIGGVIKAISHNYEKVLGNGFFYIKQEILCE